MNREEILAVYHRNAQSIAEYDRLQKEMSRLELRAGRTKEEMENTPTSWKVGIGVAAFFASAIPLALLSAISEDLATSLGMLMLLMPIAGVVFVAPRLYAKSSICNQKYEEYNKIVRQYNQLLEPSNELVDHLDLVFGFIPEQYRNSGAIQYICSYLENGRADSLKEALNLFEEELHRMKVEA